MDALCAGICGMLVGLCLNFFSTQRASQFFSTITASFVMATLAYALGALRISPNPDAVTIGALMILVPGLLFTNAMRDIIYGDTNSGINRIVQVLLGISPNPDAVTIGALMILVPGLLFTNAMRDIIYGDTNSGINRIVQVLLVAVAIALGTASAWNLAKVLWGVPVSTPAIAYALPMQCLFAWLGCIGFSILSPMPCLCNACSLGWDALAFPFYSTFMAPACSCAPWAACWPGPCMASP